MHDTGEIYKKTDTMGYSMKLSDRIMSVKPSPTLAVTALANSLKAQGLDVIGFGSGEPDFDTPRNIKDAAIRAIEDGKTKYTPAGGIGELKQAVSEKFKRDNNLEYAPSQITINVGGKHSFYNLMQVLLNDGDEVLIPAPYWVSYPSMALLAGGVPVIMDTDVTSGFKITPDELEKAIGPKTRALVINSPSNPSGAAYTADELKALAEVIKKHENLIVISDDIYESIVYDGFTFANIPMVEPSLMDRTFVLNGVSKTYSMTGWRIGYMAGPEAAIKKVDTLQSQSTSNPTSIAQWAALEAINGDQSAVQKMLDAFIRRRTLITDGLNAIDGIRAIDTQGAFYSFPDISGIYAMPGFAELVKKSEEENKSSIFGTYLLEEANVAVVPGVAFGNDKHIRMSYATSDDNITRGLDRIKEAVAKLS